MDSALVPVIDCGGQISVALWLDISWDTNVTSCGLTLFLHLQDSSCWIGVHLRTGAVC